jgi:hypothetical protein
MQAAELLARERGAPATERSGWRLGTVRLAVIVAAWWALLVGALAIAFPLPTQPAAAGGFTPVPGADAHIRALGPPGWPIPGERALAAYAWVDVRDREAVRIVAVDAEAVQVELLEGRNAGRRGWLWAPHVGP